MPAQTQPAIRLGSFQTYPENRFAVRAVLGLARAVMTGKRAPVCPLVLHGPPGTGKSHLVAAMIQAVTGGEAVVTGRVASAGDLARSEQESFADRDLQTCDVLVLEDIQHLPERAADAVCELIDRRAARRKALVITASAGPAALTHLPRRLTSRLAAGLTVQMKPLGVSSRRAVLEAAAKAKNLRLTAEALDRLAAQNSGMRALLGSLQNLAQVAANFPGPIDCADVEKVLAGTGQPTSTRTDLAAILRRVIAAFGISEKELLGTSRLRSALLPRQVAMYLARELAGLSLPRIGAAFGRDHTTVLHACRKVEAELETDVKFASVVKQLRTELV